MTSIRKSPGLRLQTSIVQDNIPVEIATGLFVGSVHAAFNVEALKSNKITHVLNLAGSYATFPEDFTYLSLSIRDKEYASLLSCLPIAAVFIDAGLKHGGVLVHCAGGRSRSPAIAMAFLMMKQQLSYSAIITHVKTLRPVVSLNAGFDAQLKCLESARGNVFIANQHLLKARLGRLAQQHQDDQLVNEVAKKRRQCQQQSSDSPSPPLLKNQSSLDMLASGYDSCSSSVGRTPAHLGFLKRNAVEWQRSVAQLVDINKDSTEAKEHESTINQMAALLDEDSAVLMNLNNCKQWFVDPQSWTLNQVTTSPEGKICCPTEACGVIVGEWRWEGLRYACGGGSIAPAFVIKKDAVCILGNMTSLSTELMNAELHAET
ncbi:hypothetical protein BBJ29_002984 [Phytophthora kernoviae]|uniref:protein-tyrosine-phosphatase n=1 Tax=Phytophthora kernoviae TaxID=325452 RepID=A0A3F2RUC2_9STRA|nr:hypothetical protein BBJ29_002984 [Phytophthora kernoviae]RLN64402.1 hypothetical protein BBP00_00003498 [Phytophthora kernoviae]